MLKYHSKHCRKRSILKYESYLGSKKVSSTWISEKTRLLPLVNLTWGLNSKCQSTIYNIAENVSFQYMNLSWGQKKSPWLGFLKNAAFTVCESNLGFKNLNVKVPFRTLQKTFHFSIWILLGVKKSLLGLDFWENAAFAASESNLGFKNLNVKVPFVTLQKTFHFKIWILLGAKKSSWLNSRILRERDFWGLWIYPGVWILNVKVPFTKLQKSKFGFFWPQGRFIY